jgi:3alpha(or 20beta)-hydroxysteroid dehydrogenase
MGRLDGKVAIVTGGSRGQGEAEARLFVREGAKVVIGDVLTDAGEALAAELGDDAVFVRHDVSDEVAWEAVVATAIERFGGVHVLVNNAGIGHMAPIAQHTVADFERVVAVNQTGVFLGMRSVIGPMTDGGGGSIVNISSGAGLRATKYMIAYAATKYAVTGMTAAGALELARYKIRVNSIHPGVVDTPMLGDSFGDQNNDALVRTTPMRRMASADEIANVALFLASDESSYMTGAHVPVDGGITA